MFNDLVPFGQQKKCGGRCRELLPISNFWKNRTTRDGLQGECKKCATNRMREYRKTPHSKEYVRSYNQRPEVLRLKQEYERSEIGKQKKREYESRPEIAERTRRYKKKYKLRTRYDLTIEQYEFELQKRNGACDGCGNPIGRKICVDHCHETNLFRGILCNYCNVSLGQCRDNPETLRKLANYVEQFNSLTG